MYGETSEYDIQRYVDKYGEKHEKLIRDALSYIDERMPIWEVDIDKDKYIANFFEKKKR